MQNLTESSWVLTESFKLSGELGRKTLEMHHWLGIVVSGLFCCLFTVTQKRCAKLICENLVLSFLCDQFKFLVTGFKCEPLKFLYFI